MLLLALLLSGCETTQGGPAPAPPKEGPYVPKQRVIRSRLTARTAQGVFNVSRQFYVFPPLQMDHKHQPMGQFSYGLDEAGRLFWISPAPSAEKIRDFIDKELRKASFETISFDALTKSETEHQVLVLNPYFSLPIQDRGTGGQLVFVRVTIATYPSSLDPAQRREIINLEGLTICHPEDDYIQVVKKTLELVLQNMGMNRDWMQDVSLYGN